MIWIQLEAAEEALFVSWKKIQHMLSNQIYNNCTLFTKTYMLKLIIYQQKAWAKRKKQHLQYL